LDLNLNQFYDEFLSDNPKFGFDLLAIALVHSDININPWKKNQKIMNFILPVTGVPFINQTRA